MPVTISLVNPDGSKSDFVHPKGSSPKAENKVVVTLKSGPDATNIQPAAFPKVVDEPSQRGGANKVDGVWEKELWARFLPERKLMFLEFRSKGGPGQKETVQTVTIVKRRYNTIYEVLADPAARRRQAILAAAAKYLPAFNTHSVNATKSYKVGKESGIPGHGTWVHSYDADGNGPSTCTLVNPGIMTLPDAKNNEIKENWGFGAGKNPKIGQKGNIGWIECDKDNLPSVGDTYILYNNMYNPFSPSYGHVGLVLHVPVTGNGLWITGDGGQGSRPDQFGMFAARWGLMGKDLPNQDPYKPAANEGPYLAGQTPLDVDKDKPIPNVNDSLYYTDTSASPNEIINRLKFHYEGGGFKPSSPRKMFGFVDVDHPGLTFSAATDAENPDHMAKARELEQKVNDVIKETLGGWIFNGHGT
ncbi:MAG: hypothetical protein JNL83_11205 [Myxococcales bacterium]|nr:hypothetical protein [Myxococcales bacterium]